MTTGRLEWVFFDIGGTLGNVTLTPLKLTPFLSTAGLLRAFHDILGLRLGVITNIPASLTRDNIESMLQAAGLLDRISPSAIITSQDGHGSKPTATIYNFAAQKVEAPLSRCLFVGENQMEVEGAIQAGMSGIHLSVDN